MGELTLGEQSHREIALGDCGLTGYMHLSSDGRPVEEERDVRVGLDLTYLARPQRRREQQRVLLQALEQDGARSRTPTITNRDKCHRARLRYTGATRLIHPVV